MNDGTVIEQRTIQVIPEAERYGRPRDLFTMWFAANLHPLAVVTGALASTVFGLSIIWALVAWTLGLAVGAFLMALHSAQGAQLGLPQMIQSRAQFGSWGALLFVLVTITMYIGFFTSTLAVGGEALQLGFGEGLGTFGGVAIAAVIGIIVASFGYKVIHKLGQVVTFVSGGLIVIASIWIFSSISTREAILSSGDFSLVGFCAVIAIGAVWLLAYGPYVSDYSRYMPATLAGRKSTFWATYFGGFLGSLLPMTLGVAIGLVAKEDNILAAVTGIYGELFGRIFLIGFGLVLVHVNAMNLYGSVLCSVTAIQTFKRNWSPGPRTRFTIALIIASLCFLLAMSMSGDIMGGFLTFINILTYVLIPWSAINLVDFYLVRSGKYDLESISSADGGIYGRYQPRALAAYGFGLLAQVPFLSMSFYVGPIANALGDVDIAWLVGLVASAGAFLFSSSFERKKKLPGSVTN